MMLISDRLASTGVGEGNGEMRVDEERLVRAPGPRVRGACGDLPRGTIECLTR